MIHAGVEPASRLFRQRALLVGQMDHDRAGDGNRPHIASGREKTDALSLSYACIGSPSRIRTCDSLINSQVLYRLSYRGIIGPDDMIRTCDILLPKQALYQAELHLDYGGGGGIRTRAPCGLTI